MCIVNKMEVEEKKIVIERISKIKDKEILKRIGQFIFKFKPDIHYTENSNGIFIDTADFDDIFFDEIKKIIENK